MTSENGTNRPDYSESDLIRSLGELPEETLQQLEQFPPALLETLTGLSPEARNSLLRMPLETLCQLSGIAAPTLEWLGRLVASSGPELLTQIAQLAKASPEAVLRLQEIPDQALEMLSVLSSDVLMSLIALPPDQLANLPLVIRALGETVDEGDIPSRDSSALGEVPPHLIETLDLFSPEAVQLLSKF